MPQSGYTPIQLYSSSTPTNQPSAGNLTNDTKGSELAVNIADGKLFYKDASNNVQTLADKTWVGTVTNVSALTIGTSGTDLSSTVANPTSTPVITLNVPTASAANRGALSNTDWSTFNAKQAALVSGTNIKTVNGTTLLGSGDLGTIGVGYGGTGITTTPTNGQIPIGNGTNYTAATLTAGGGIAVTNGTGSVTIATSSPTFSAYGNISQTISNATFTKITLNAENYDTANCFDSTTNYRFTPNVAGYYQLNLKTAIFATSITRIIVEFRKNGNGANNGRALDLSGALSTLNISAASNLMYFNGSTDYCELWVYVEATGTITLSQVGDPNTCFFQGSMIRAA